MPTLIGELRRLEFSLLTGDYPGEEEDDDQLVH